MLTKHFPPITHLFADDGRIPNNPKLPLVLYRGGIALAGSPDPELLIEKTFDANGWGDMWRNGIFPYVHYHAMIHEVLAIARGRAKVRFGGAAGNELDLAAGDVAVLPAGTGHQCLWAAPGLCVIGTFKGWSRITIMRSRRPATAGDTLLMPSTTRAPSPPPWTASSARPWT